MNRLGLSHALSYTLSNPIFLERASDGKPEQRSFLAKIWHYVRHPWALLFSPFALRRPGQKDAEDKPCLNLNQLSTPGAIEHAILLRRQ
ncbi:hypothetical protein ANO14919_143180 [Xylariales sp. No.14919]|nr:hypothetical protein ANO14919_143180 [Xylariales sp. No.14919]